MLALEPQLLNSEVFGPFVFGCLATLAHADDTLLRSVTILGHGVGKAGGNRGHRFFEYWVAQYTSSNSLDHDKCTGVPRGCQEYQPRKTIYVSFMNRGQAQKQGL